MEMKGFKRWTAMLLIFAAAAGVCPAGVVNAAGEAVLDQRQELKLGNTWVNADYPRYQTFTPEITGSLSRLELNIFDFYGSPGKLQAIIYKESDQSTPLAIAQKELFDTGWVSLDFTGTEPYLIKDTMYRMVISTENGQPSGFGWYSYSGDPYPRGYSAAFGYDFSFRTFMIPDYSLSMSESRLSSAMSSIAADGASQTTVTVKLMDAQGSPITTGGETVAIHTTAGAITPVTDNQNGTYTATLTASTTAGAATISASIGGSALTSTTTVQFVPGAPSAADSTIEAADAALTADGTSQTAITVKLVDAHGNALTSGGAAVAITTTNGTVGAVTDNHNGTYQAILTAPATVGTATVSASVGGSALPGTVNVQFVPGAVSMASSTIEAADAVLTADGTSQTAITVKLKDAHGNALPSGGAAVAITTTAGTVSAVTDNHNGTYTATLTAPVTAGTATVSASVGGSALTRTASVQLVPGAVSTASSTIEAADAVLTADGTSQTAITVKLKDAHGNALPSGGAAVAVATTNGTVSAVTDNHNGEYTAILTASTTVGTAVISAIVDGAEWDGTAEVNLVPGEVSVTDSTITASNPIVRADGSAQTEIAVLLKDDYGHPLADKRVLLQASGGQSVIHEVKALTDSDGAKLYFGSVILQLRASLMLQRSKQAV